MAAVADHPDEVAARFATTRWDIVLASAHTQVPGAGEALTDLCRTYWPPLYAFVRRRGYSATDAEDLVQEFFLQFLQAQTVKKADPLRGRFRTFLLHAIQNFLANQWDHARAAKRGGKFQFVPLEELTMEESNLPASADSAETSFDLRWARAIIDLAFKQLQGEAAARGKTEVFETLREFLTADANSSYEAAAASLKIPSSAVKTAIHRMRANFRIIIRREVARTVSSPAEIDDELRYLRELLGSQATEPAAG